MTKRNEEQFGYCITTAPLPLVPPPPMPTSRTKAMAVPIPSGPGRSLPPFLPRTHSDSLVRLQLHTPHDKAKEHLEGELAEAENQDQGRFVCSWGSG